MPANKPTTYRTKHHRNYDCGHSHRTIETGLKCFKRHMFLTDFKCEECGKIRRGFRVTKCKHCGCETSVVTTPFDPDYFFMQASDDTIEWRSLNPAEQHEIAELFHKKKYKKENK